MPLVHLAAKEKKYIESQRFFFLFVEVYEKSVQMYNLIVLLNMKILYGSSIALSSLIQIFPDPRVINNVNSLWIEFFLTNERKSNILFSISSFKAL